MKSAAYDAKNVEQVAQALYRATTPSGVASWRGLSRAARDDQTAAAIRDEWLGIATAALDLTHGIRGRRWP